MMRKWMLCLIGVAMLGTVHAQDLIFRGSGGWGPDSTYNRLYDQDSVITFSGKVTGKVDTTTMIDGIASGVTALVKTPNGGTAHVDLGPAWYLDQQADPINVGDQVTVTGSKILIDGRGLILAQKVIRNNKVLYLRELSGFPMWVAWRGHVTVGRNQPPTTAASNLRRIEGNILRIETVEDLQLGTVSRVLVVATPTGEMRVDVGPEWFLARQDVAFQPSGNIVVLGSVPVNPGGLGNVILADSLWWDNQYFVLRNGGVPLWNAWRSGGR